MNPTKFHPTTLIIGLCLMILFPVFSIAQSLIPLTYEGSVTDKRGYPLVQQPLTLKGTIFQDRIGGIIVYQETKVTHSDASGRFAEPFGQGKYLSGNAVNIDPTRAPYFFMVEIQRDEASDFSLAYARPIIGNREVINIAAQEKPAIGTANPRGNLETSSGDIYLDSPSKGVIMTSPNGQCWRLTITDRGDILTQAIQCPN